MDEERGSQMSEMVTVTMVFEIDAAEFKKKNPLTTLTPWGIPHSIALGDFLERVDELESRIKRDTR